MLLIELMSLIDGRFEVSNVIGTKKKHVVVYGNKTALENFVRDNNIPTLYGVLNTSWNNEDKAVIQVPIKQ